MILCTLGTHPEPFDRALDWLLAARGDERLVVQHGATPPRLEEPGVEWHASLSYDELTAAMRAADVVVCHGGVGSLMTALSLGIRPVAIPRLHDHGEHVDDHQLEISAELAGAGYILACLSREELPAVLEAARQTPAEPRTKPAKLVRHAILAAGGDPDRSPSHR